LNGGLWLTGRDQIPTFGPDWRTKITVALDEKPSSPASSERPIAAGRLTQHEGGGGIAAMQIAAAAARSNTTYFYAFQPIVGRRKSAESLFYQAVASRHSSPLGGCNSATSL
jgi:hypothetical protein